MLVTGAFKHGPRLHSSLNAALTLHLLSAHPLLLTPKIIATVLCYDRRMCVHAWQMHHMVDRSRLHKAGCVRMSLRVRDRMLRVQSCATHKEIRSRWVKQQK